MKNEPLKIVEHPSSDGTPYLYTGWYHIDEVSNGNSTSRMLVGSDTTYYLNQRAIVTVEYLKSVDLFTNNWGDNGLEIIFYGEGAKNLARGSGGALGRQIGFVLDDELIYITRVNAKVNSGMSALIYSKEEEPDLKQLKKKIEVSAGMK